MTSELSTSCFRLKKLYQVGACPVTCSFFGIANMFDTHGEFDTSTQTFLRLSATSVSSASFSVLDRQNGDLELGIASDSISTSNYSARDGDS